MATNSPLATYTRISPNRSSPRQNKIDTITIHCVVGQWTAKQGCDFFADPNRGASANYVVGKDGSIGLCVEEKDRAWTTGGDFSTNGISGSMNDQRAVTIEVASDTYAPYAVTDAAYNALIRLVADICKRNGIKQLKWKGDRNLVGRTDLQNMTVHRWFAYKSCPGDYLYERHGDIANKVNAILNNGTSTTPIKPPYKAVVNATDGLNCRTGASTSTNIVKTYLNNTTLTISKESNGWGFTGEGWVSLDYVTKLPQEEDEEMTQETFNKYMNAYLAELEKKEATFDKEAVDWAKENGLISGDGKGNLMPKRFITRGECMIVLKRLYEKLAK